MAARRGKGQRDRTKERHWRRIVRQWRGSGLSVREFCDWQALSEPSFYAWRRELSKRDRESAAAATDITAACDGRAVNQNGPGRTSVAAFLPVRVVADGAPEYPAASPRTNDIEVHLPSGVRLAVPAGCDRRALVEVLAALEIRPC
jgi:hypothetical protein